MSKIEWTGRTWNIVTGCRHVSPGCRICYAERMAERLRRMGLKKYAKGFEPVLHPDLLDQPLRWRKGQTIFVCSMSDLFQEFVPDEFIARALETMREARQHRFQLLTKRGGRMRDLIRRQHADLADLEHIWLGVSVENKKHGLPRIEELRDTPAGLRFLSIEPLLEDLGPLELRGIDWVIVGGESGPSASPMEADWVRSIRDQCQEANVPFFFKQWGGVNKKKAGRELDGRVHAALPG